MPLYWLLLTCMVLHNLGWLVTVHFFTWHLLMDSDPNLDTSAFQPKDPDPKLMTAVLKERCFRSLKLGSDCHFDNLYSLNCIADLRAQLVCSILFSSLLHLWKYLFGTGFRGWGVVDLVGTPQELKKIIMIIIALFSRLCTFFTLDFLVPKKVKW